MQTTRSEGQNRNPPSSGARNQTFLTQFAHWNISSWHWRSQTVSTEVSALMERLGESMLLPQVHQIPVITQMIASSVTLTSVWKTDAHLHVSQEIAFPIIQESTINSANIVTNKTSIMKSSSFHCHLNCQSINSTHQVDYELLLCVLNKWLIDCYHEQTWWARVKFILCEWN